MVCYLTYTQLLHALKTEEKAIMPFIFIILLCSLITSSAQPINGSATDESSLLSFKSFVTSDPNNAISTNWSQGSPFCTWNGVTCSPRHQRVTSLNLFDFDLTGTIPPHIGNLSFLTYLDIRNNSFSGSVPETIGNLFHLRELRMNVNQLSGNLPPSLGALRNLEILDFSDNNLRGNVPWGIFNITTLREIAFTRNYQLTGELPSEICPPSARLQQLRLSMNQFVGEIPSGLANCRDLMTISFSINNFTGRLPADIGNISGLQYLALGRNRLTGTIPSSIGNLSRLIWLDIQENDFQGTVPSEIGHLSSLNVLSFGVNRLSGDLPSSVFNLTKLHTLSITSNQLSGIIPQSIDTSLPNLQRMYLGMNMFSGELPNTVSNLSQLIVLDIINNSFSGLVPTNLGNLRRLQVLRVGSNNFTNDLSIPGQEFLTSLTNCKNLSYLGVDNNPMTGELPISIGNLSASLQGFNARTCGIRGTIPSEIGRLNGLIVLNLAFNNLSGQVPITLGSLSNLQTVSLWGNILTGTLSDSICSLENLFQLDFSDNNLSGSVPACLGNMSLLEEIYLRNNSFNSTIPSTLWHNTRIQVLSLSMNTFHGSLPNEIGNLNNLKELFLYDNQLSGNIPVTVGELHSLTTIELQKNRFGGSIPASLGNLHALENIDLSLNNLTGPIPRSIENLEYLVSFNVSFNDLTGVIPDGGNFGNFTAGYFAGNEGLCGASRFEVEACLSSRSNNSRVDHHKILKYILPSVASVVVLSIFVLWLLRRFVRKSTPSSSLLDSSLGRTRMRISYYEVLRATNNLDVENLIGKGGIGSVYKALLSNEKVVAIKVFNLDIQGAFKSFDTECEIMRSLRHRNLVKIITSCSNFDFKALVMEYMPNGNLEKWLYYPDYILSIDQRFQIMVDVASAVEYLHYGYSSPIVHCDLKPSNILLGEDMVAHLGDFGIAKLLMEDSVAEQTKTLGTIGYMAPEYGSSGLVSTMTDIYSYGILLMETFTKRKPTNEQFTGELTLHKLVSESYPSTIMQIIDADLLNVEQKAKSHVEECLKSIMELAILCVANLPEERPVMIQVLIRLKKIKAGLQALYH